MSNINLFLLALNNFDSPKILCISMMSSYKKSICSNEYYYGYGEI